MKKTLRGTPKHLSQNGTLSEFTYLMFTLPFKCNYRCLKCFNLENNQISDVSKSKENFLSLAKTLEIIHEAKSLDCKVVVIAGEGEPTLDKNIKKIITTINKLEMIPIIYSNGSSLKPEIADFYHDNNVCLVIALDSLNANTHQNLAGTREVILPTVLENIKYLRKKYRDKINVENEIKVVNIAINMTLTSHNQNEIEEIKNFSGDDIYFICNPLAHDGNAKGYWNNLIKDDSDIEIHRGLIKRYSESGGPLTLDNNGLCGYSINGIAIGPTGQYMTCAYTSKTNGLFGTVYDYSLKDIYGFKKNMESKHYSQFGNLPCLIRDSSFQIYIESIKESNK